MRRTSSKEGKKRTSRRRLRPREDFVFDETDGTIRSSVARTGNSNTPATRGTKTSSYASRFRS